jgi:hypothetical protein
MGRTMPCPFWTNGTNIQRPSADFPYPRYRPYGPRRTSGLLVRVSSTSSGEMPCQLMCAVFPPASSALSHSKLSIRTGSLRLDCISFVFTLSIPTAGEPRNYVFVLARCLTRLPFEGLALSTRRAPDSACLTG